MTSSGRMYFVSNVAVLDTVQVSLYFLSKRLGNGKTWKSLLSDKIYTNYVLFGAHEPKKAAYIKNFETNISRLSQFINILCRTYFITADSSGSCSSVTAKGKNQ